MATQDILNTVSRQINLPQLSLVKRVEEGHISDNYIVEGGGQKYFLKRYSKDPERVNNIHWVEDFFSQNGVPAICALGQSGKKMVQIDGYAWAVYPYIEGSIRKRTELSVTALQSMGKMLAKIHGLTIDTPPSINLKRFSFWDIAKFLERAGVIEKIIMDKAERNDFDNGVLADLKIKRHLIKDISDPESHKLLNECITHGDCQYNNMFFSQDDSVEWIFDWEATAIAPRMYEFVRSLELMCFDGSYTDLDFKQAEIYIKAYHEALPFEPAELIEGYKIFRGRFTATIWVEEAHYIDCNFRADKFLATEMARLTYHSQNFDAHLERLISFI
jgi:Ser/Thr protein kinase RdoA (MazF antagonist)